MRSSSRVFLWAFLLLTGAALGAAGMSVTAAIRGSAIFPDVPEGAYFDQAVGDMYSIGVIKGYTNGKFGPNDFVTRGQVAVMMQRLRDEMLGSGAAQSSRQSSSTSSRSSSSSTSSSAYNEFGAFRFTSDTFSIPETVASLTISVDREGGTAGSVSVKYSVKSGTATAGEDFVAVDQSTLTFADGQQSRTFTISLKEDSLSEGSETVILELLAPTGGATLGSPSTATLTILDNEAPSSGGSSSSSAASQVAGAGALGFSALAYEVRENSAAATVTVVRTGGSSGQVGISYATGDQTARAGSEYTTTNGALTFASGETSKTFSVPITDDAAVDGKKTLTLTLSAPTGGAGLGVTSATLSIADDEVGSFGTGSFMFSRSTFDATEDDGIATVIVNRVGGTLHTASVSYTTINGSAAPGLDYTTTSGTLTFAPGEQSKAFTVPIIRDNTSDSGEYFTVTLSSPTTGAQLGSPISAQVNIYD